jgi:hypothetical protein
MVPKRRRLPFLVSGHLLRGVAISAALLAAPHVAAAAEPLYPDSTAVPGISFRWDTHRQLAPGSDNWPLTWSADGHQYTSFGDGGGFEGNETTGRVSLGFARIEGSADSYRGVNVWGGARTETAAKFNGKSRGVLAVGTDLYMWRCGAGSTDANFEFQQLYKSTDDARTWQAANWQFPGSLTFYCPTFLQFGQGYAGARDGYVYMYAAERNSDVWEVHTPGRVSLMRAPKDRLMERAAYEFFAGQDPSSGAPRWSDSVAERAPVLEDSNGARLPSAIYNPGLRRYFLLVGRAPRFSGNVSIFDAPEPWGPWTTVLYEDAWGRGHVDPSTFFLNFSPKWWGDGGKSFVLAFTGGGDLDSWNTVEGSFTASGGDGRAGARGDDDGGVSAPPRRAATTTPPGTAPVADDTPAEAPQTPDTQDPDPTEPRATAEGGGDEDAGGSDDAGAGPGTTGDDDDAEPAEVTDDAAGSTTRETARAMASLGAGSSSSSSSPGRSASAADSGTAAGRGTSPTADAATDAGPRGTGDATSAAAATVGAPTAAPRAAEASSSVPELGIIPRRSRRPPESRTGGGEEPTAPDEAYDETGAVADESSDEPAAAPAATTVTAPGAPEAASGEPRLVGTLDRGAGGALVALVVPANAATPIPVRAGDAVGEWSVETVERRALTLRSGDRTLVLRLFGAARRGS